ncbi:hypothetical protein [Paraburkholderia sp. 32]|uniref:hypothetical protein n=1 Tax=Paraburkholderia sp. 32 TaxID=2991057 RepID=UPI003D25856A
MAASQRLREGFKEAEHTWTAQPADTAFGSDSVHAALRHAFPRWSSEAIEDSIDDTAILVNSWKSLSFAEKKEVVEAQWIASSRKSGPAVLLDAIQRRILPGVESERKRR